MAPSRDNANNGYVETSSPTAASRRSDSPGGRNGFEPTWVHELELAGPIPDLVAPSRRDGGSYQQARLLTRIHGQPIGFVELAARAGRISAAAIIEAVTASLGGAIDAHLRTDGIPIGRLTESGLPAIDSPTCEAVGPFGDPDPFVSVIVCTRDRPQSLHRALRSVLASDYDRREILVVDSAPTTGAARAVVAELSDASVRYLHEPLPGLARARNHGLREARGEIVMFTDDDVIADASWLNGLIRGFSRSAKVGCVTGLLSTAELETPAQAFVDRKVGWPKGTDRVLYDRDSHRRVQPLHPYTVGLFGTGANFGVSKSAIDAIGGFDEALGTGTPACSGEDLDYFLRVILAGFSIAYEPAAVVWHFNHRDEAALRAQIYGYGSGLAAYGLKHLLSRDTAWDVVRRLPRAIARAAWLVRSRTRAPGLSTKLWLAELHGFLAGPLNYRRSRRRLRALESGHGR